MIFFNSKHTVLNMFLCASLCQFFSYFALRVSCKSKYGTIAMKSWLLWMRFCREKYVRIKFTLCNNLNYLEKIVWSVCIFSWAKHTPRKCNKNNSSEPGGKHAILLQIKGFYPKCKQTKRQNTQLDFTVFMVSSQMALFIKRSVFVGVKFAPISFKPSLLYKEQ